MAATLPTKLPPVRQDKSIKKEALDRFTMPDTGGNPWDRQNRNYAKTGQDADPRGDPFDMYD